MAPVIRCLQHSRKLKPVVCVTAQHRQMLDQMMQVFGLKPDYDLNIMTERQSLVEVTKRTLDGVTEVLHKVRPACVVVQGDTTTAFGASLAAFYEQTPVAHVEAGLRSHDKRNPFPEEINRRLTTHLADLHFAPTATARGNLLAEGVDRKKVAVTGNTVVDALRFMMHAVNGAAAHLDGLESIDWKQDIPVLVTAHRRENWDKIGQICEALRAVVLLDSRIHVIFPVHPNPVLRHAVETEVGGARRVHLLPALPYPDFLGLMKYCRVVVTDSGGVQEEVVSLGKRVVVMRETTERPEVISSGYGILAGTQPISIVRAVAMALATETRSPRRNPFGDGRAAERIVRRLEIHLQSAHPHAQL